MEGKEESSWKFIIRHTCGCGRSEMQEVWWPGGEIIVS